ncbi:hypothetical protein GCM10015535_04010 [Streptomyces gelaticus]|uniref:Uncharacterized protein n=1 Tax=Streptomyces gelaticus TaxID=285446 RepID=A0ABQ2VQS3_9ACTN|nr:hypothetical protein GCM10015535_04010 [Streptomyces gelaticus]
MTDFASERDRGPGQARQLPTTVSRGGQAEAAPLVNGVSPANEPSPCKQRIPVTGDQEDGSAF